MRSRKIASRPITIVQVGLSEFRAIVRNGATKVYDYSWTKRIWFHLAQARRPHSCVGLLDSGGRGNLMLQSAYNRMVWSGAFDSQFHARPKNITRDDLAMINASLLTPVRDKVFDLAWWRALSRFCCIAMRCTRCNDESPRSTWRDRWVRFKSRKYSLLARTPEGRLLAELPLNHVEKWVRPTFSDKDTSVLDADEHFHLVY